MDTKICTKCGEPKDLTQYYTAHSHSTCKSCISTRHRAWQAANPEKTRAYVKAYYAAHREKIRAYNRTYQAAKTEKAKAYDRLKDMMLSLGLSLGTHEPANVERSERSERARHLQKEITCT